MDPLPSAGEGTAYQLQSIGLCASKVSHIFVTHHHGDHCFGLGPLIAARHAAFARRRCDLPFGFSFQQRAFCCECVQQRSAGRLLAAHHRHQARQQHSRRGLDVGGSQLRTTDAPRSLW